MLPFILIILEVYIRIDLKESMKKPWQHGEYLQKWFVLLRIIQSWNEYLRLYLHGKRKPGLKKKCGIRCKKIRPVRGHLFVATLKGKISQLNRKPTGCCRSPTTSLHTTALSCLLPCAQCSKPNVSLPFIKSFSSVLYGTYPFISIFPQIRWTSNSIHSMLSRRICTLN